MKATNETMTITVEPFAAAEVREYLTKTAKECGMTVDHLASVYLINAIEDRQIARREGRFAKPTITVELDEPLAKRLDATCKRHHNCRPDAVTRMALRSVLPEMAE